MQDTFNRLGEIGIVPVVKIEKASDAVPLGRALVAGNLPVVEITFRTAAAEESIRILLPRSAGDTRRRRHSAQH